MSLTGNLSSRDLGSFPPANTNHDRGRVLKRFRDGPSDREVFSRAVLGGAFFILRRGYSEPGFLTALALLLALIHRSDPWPLAGHPEAMKMSCRPDYFQTSAWN